MPDAAAILARLDAIMAELAELRAEVAGAEGADEKGVSIVDTLADDLAADDLAADDLLDTHAASARFGYPADSIRKWCREEDLGVRRGGRWLVSIPRLQRRLNGG